MKRYRMAWCQAFLNEAIYGFLRLSYVFFNPSRKVSSSQKKAVHHAISVLLGPIRTSGGPLGQLGGLVAIYFLIFPISHPFNTKPVWVASCLCVTFTATTDHDVYQS